MVLACSARLDAATFEEIVMSCDQSASKVSTKVCPADIKLLILC